MSADGSIYSNMYVFTKPFAQAECDTRSIFKQGLTGLNSKIFFS